MTRLAAQRPDVELFSHIAVIDQLVTRAIDRCLPGGLTRAQFNILNRLVTEVRRFSPAELADDFLLSKGAVTNLLQKLEARGFIEVDADLADGRRRWVALTAHGIDAWKASALALRPLMEDLRRDFDGEGLEGAVSMLAGLRDWLARPI